MKEWEQKAVNLLEKSLVPLPQEINELDWKVDISEKGDRLARHLSAFSNYPGGGFLAFGIGNDGAKVGVENSQCTEILKKIGNIARENVEPQIIVSHYVAEINGSNILFVYVPEAPSRPVHLRSESIYESYTRSAGQTRKMNKQEVALIISSSTNNLTFESKLATGVLDTQSLLSKLDFVSYFDLCKKPLPKDNQSIVDVLVSERPLTRMAKEDRVRACYWHACLKSASGDFMTNESIRKRFNIPDKSYTVASKIITEALEAKSVQYKENNKTHESGFCYKRGVPF